MGIIPDDQYATMLEQLNRDAPRNINALIVFTLFLLVFTIIGNSMVVYFTAATRSLRTAPNILLANMSAAAAALAILAFKHFVQSLMADGSYVGVGVVGCVIQGVAGLVICAVFIISISLTGYERYQSIALTRDTKLSQVMTMVVLSWVFSVLFGFIPAFAQKWDLLIVRPCGLYCAVRWSDPSVAGRITSIAAILIVSVPLTLTAYFYYQIIKVTLPENERNFKGMTKYVTVLLFDNINSPSNRAPTSQFAEQNSMASKTSAVMTMIYQSNSRRSMQQLLVRKSLSIVILFMSLWTPFFVSALYEIFSGRTVPSWLDLCCYMGVTLNGIANPFLNMFLDTRYKKAAKSLWRKLTGSKNDPSETKQIRIGRTSIMSSARRESE